jgi:hypothetical protein
MVQRARNMDRNESNGGPRKIFVNSEEFVPHGDSLGAWQLGKPWNVWPLEEVEVDCGKSER